MNMKWKVRMVKVRMVQAAGHTIQCAAEHVCKWECNWDAGIMLAFCKTCKIIYVANNYSLVTPLKEDDF